MGVCLRAANRVNHRAVAGPVEEGARFQLEDTGAGGRPRYTARYHRPIGRSRPRLLVQAAQERTTSTAPSATMAAPASFGALMGSTGDDSHP